MKKFRFFLCVLLTTVVFWCYHNYYKLSRKRQKTQMQSQAPAMVLTVSTVKPHVTAVKRYIDAVGQCTAVGSITLVSKITGTLRKIKAENGGSVQAGDVLFQFNDDTPKAVLQQAEAQLALDKAKHDLNVLQLQRSEKLRSQNFVSEQEYDTYKANVAVSQAQMDMDNAIIRQRRIGLEDYTLSAPFAGEIGKSAVNEGAYIQAGTVLATLNRLQPIYADSFLAERHLKALLQAKRDEITVEARLLDDPSVRQTGKLVFIGNAVEKTTGTFDIRAEFPNADKQFWPGRSVDIKICYQTVPNVILVPESAVHEGTHGSFVYVINDKGLAEMKSVTMEQTYEHWVVVHGLNGDEQVIASGHVLLAPGVPVKSIGTVAVPSSLKPLAFYSPTKKSKTECFLPPCLSSKKFPKVRCRTSHSMVLSAMYIAPFAEQKTKPIVTRS